MTPSTIIARKRDGHALTEAQVREFIQGYATDTIPDYQMSALAMAIYLQGMSTEETVALTDAMLCSGVQLSYPKQAPPRVDKHSTGGIGDKVSLILAPLLACCDLWVPMISGRGLGPTGGTLDKLESIPGFRVDLSLTEMLQALQTCGCVINGATEQLAPADRKLYALRDVTATVASIPLITASIMSKKLAEGLQALVLDVKCGSGAFMKTPEVAIELARSLVDVGQQMGVPTTALITDMNQPLGKMVGNALEVDESIDVLAGRKNAPSDLIELTLALGGQLLTDVKQVESRGEGIDLLKKHIASGAALERFTQLVNAQQGDLSAPRPRAPVTQILSPASGFITQIDSEQIGQAVILMGGGRKIVSDQIDPSVGLEMLVRLGDRVTQGQPLLNLFANEKQRTEVETILTESITISNESVRAPSLVLSTIGPKTIR